MTSLKRGLMLAIFTGMGLVQTHVVGAEQAAGVKPADTLASIRLIDAQGASLTILRESLSEILSQIASDPAQAKVFSSPSALAEQLTLTLRSKGYPIAQVLYLAKDQVQEKDATQKQSLTFRVVLGVIGQVTVGNNRSKVGSDFIRAQALHALCGADAQFTQGQCTLEAPRLERATAILQAIPGITEVAVRFSPQGVGPGQTQVVLDINSHSDELTRAKGFVTVDNFGVPSSGQTRFGVNVGANSLVREGDSVDITVYDTDKNAWTGLLDWNQPLGDSGLRGDIQLAQSQYTTALGSSNISGKSQSVSLGVFDPITLNFDAVQSLQYSVGYMVSKGGITGFTDFQDRKIPFASIALVGNTGIRSTSYDQTYLLWNVKATGGKVSDSAQQAQAADANSAQVLNTFAKANLQLAGRYTPEQSNWFTGFNLKAQGASRNLDPSLMVAWGGVDGVKAYPVTEGSFTNGAIGTVSVGRRFHWEAGLQTEVSLFADYAAGQIWANTWTAWNQNNPSMSNTRHLYDYGLNVDARYGRFTGAIAVAQKWASSQNSITGAQAAKGRIWVVGRYAF